jgi:hypothetical protein
MKNEELLLFIIIAIVTGYCRKYIKNKYYKLSISNKYLIFDF